MNASAAGSRWQERDLVFTSTVGTPLEPTNLNDRLHAQVEVAELPKKGMHSLRNLLRLGACLQRRFASGGDGGSGPLANLAHDGHVRARDAGCQGTKWVFPGRRGEGRPLRSKATALQRVVPTSMPSRLMRFPGLRAMRRSNRLMNWCGMKKAVTSMRTEMIARKTKREFRSEQLWRTVPAARVSSTTCRLLLTGENTSCRIPSRSRSCRLGLEPTTV